MASWRITLGFLIAAVAAGGACATDPGVSGTSNTGGSNTGGNNTGGSNTGGAGGGSATCDPACGVGFTCCDGACVNTANDINNCGACGDVCDGPHPFCNNGVACEQAPCEDTTCEAGSTCCGVVCCAPGQLCCEVNQGGPSTGPQCVDAVDGTCPGGCPACN